MAQRERIAGTDEVIAGSRSVSSISEASRKKETSAGASLDVAGVPTRTGHKHRVRAGEHVEAGTPAATSPFSRLRQAREAKGLTLEQAAVSAQIRPHYLEIIEAGQLDKLPGLTYARNMLERYAVLLGFDTEVVLTEACLPAFFEGETLRASQRMAARAKGSPLWVSTGAPAPRMRRRRFFGFVSAAALIAVVAAVLLLSLL